MLRDLLDRSKCALGYHVEAWQYVASDACRQTSRCARCGVVSERTVHRWEGWRQSGADDCRETRTCQRCRQQEARDAHVWDTWTWDADADAAAQTDPAGAVVTAACVQRVSCSRCGVPGSDTRLAHDPDAWTWSPFYEAHVRVCRRCGRQTFAGADGEELPVSWQEADAAIMHVMEASSVEDVRRRLESRRSTLYSPVAAHGFRFVSDQRTADDGDRAVVDQLATFVARCRDEGLDAVFGRPEPNVPSASASPATSSPGLSSPGSSSYGPSHVASVPASAAAPPPRPATARLDIRLCGHWRHTESTASGDFSLVTDSHMVLDASGRFVWWSQSASGAFGTRTSDREVGQWTSDAAELCLVFDTGESFSREYHVSGDEMLLPAEARYRFWTRVG